MGGGSNEPACFLDGCALARSSLSLPRFRCVLLYFRFALMCHRSRQISEASAFFTQRGSDCSNGQQVYLGIVRVL